MPKFGTICAIILCWHIVPIALSCEVLAKIKSETKKPFIFELSIPETFTEEIDFTEPSQKEILIKAPECATKRWKLLTMTREEDGTLVVADEAYTKLDGIGELTIQIGDELQPHVKQRLGVICSEATMNLCA